MARKRGRAILNKIDFLLVCTCLCLAYGCSVKEPAPAPAFPASPIQVTTAATYTYPLKISANGRYLVDQNGKPFRIQGDSAQSLIANLTVATENLSASESRIRDTDYAQEMVSFTRAQILTQAGTAMLAQANQAPQQVLQLLRG